MIAIILMALLNRIRGGGLYIGQYLRETLHVKPVFVVSPLVGIVAWLAGNSLLGALGFALGYLLWATPAWGRWFDLGHLPVDSSRGYGDPLEKWIDRLADGDDLTAMVLRHGIMGGLAVSLIAGFTQNILLLAFVMILPWMIVKSYEVSWRWNPDLAIPAAEVLTGISWGVFIWTASLFH